MLLENRENNSSFRGRSRRRRHSLSRASEQHRRDFAERAGIVQDLGEAINSVIVALVETMYEDHHLAFIRFAQKPGEGCDRLVLAEVLLQTLSRGRGSAKIGSVERGRYDE